MATSRFEIRRGRTGAFRFVLVAKNGEVVATSENYTTKARCRTGIKAVFACFDANPAFAGTPDIVDTTMR